MTGHVTECITIRGCSVCFFQIDARRYCNTRIYSNDKKKEDRTTRALHKRSQQLSLVKNWCSVIRHDPDISQNLLIDYILATVFAFIFSIDIGFIGLIFKQRGLKQKRMLTRLETKSF